MKFFKTEDYSFCEQILLFPVTKLSRIRAILLNPHIPIDAAVRIDSEMEYQIKNTVKDRIFTAVHGDLEDRPHHKAPYMKMILDPTDKGEKLCEKLGY